MLWDGNDRELLELERSLKSLLRRFTYRPGWEFSVEWGRLEIRATVVDATCPTQECPLRYTTALPRHVPEDFNWTRWLFDHVMRMERHEAQEFFQVDGRPPYDPHAND